MKVHALTDYTTVNGPGVRSMIHVQGCYGMSCAPYCWNPDTHDENLGTDKSLNDLISWLEAIPGTVGLTLSGGEPLQQSWQVLTLVRAIRCIKDPTEYSIGMYTGYTQAELDQDNYWQELKTYLDFAVMGRYNPLKATIEIPMCSSSNQKLVLFSDRYTMNDFTKQQVEFTIKEDSLVQITGFPVGVHEKLFSAIVK